MLQWFEQRRRQVLLIINNFRFINSQDEIRDVALNYLIRLSLVRSFVIKNPYILDSIDITPNQNFAEYCKFNKIDHKKVMAKAKEQFLDKGLLEMFQYILFLKKCLGVLPNFMLPEKIG